MEVAEQLEVADFTGYATKADLECTDGRTILKDAFKHQHGRTIPLVWSHNAMEDPENVLGHALLEARDGHMYAHAFFNQNPKSQKAKHMVEHKDITHLSIRAGHLKEQAGKVMHGMIQELSLVLAGANPGAVIEQVNLSHGYEDIELDAATIYTDEEIELVHADGERTVQDVYDELSDDQKQLVHFMVAQALEGKTQIEHSDSTEGSDDESAESEEGEESEEGSEDEKSEDDTEKSEDEESEGDEKTEDSLNHQEGTSMNVFDQNGGGGAEQKEKHILHADDVRGIMRAAVRGGSFMDALGDYALQHGITDIETLFPEAKLIDGATPEWIKRRTEWVTGVLNDCSKTPYARIKTRTADITQEEARAKGYIKGNMKKEEWFGVSQRTTTPTTVYKKQKLDRDDIIDVTEFDMVAWMKGEMRVMLEEEIARAILVGDGREVDDEDKVRDPVGVTDGAGIRSILHDHELYVSHVTVNVDDASSSWEEVVDTILLNRRFYRGSGGATFYTTAEAVARLLLSRDGFGRKVYDNEADLKTQMRVSNIVEVEILEEYPDVIGIIVNLKDYNVGTDRGGAITSFEDFDIDFNQNKYLLETRLSGALVKYKSAVVVNRTAAANVKRVPTEPAFDEETGVVTIPTVTGVVYKDGEGNTLTAGAQTALDEGESLEVVAVPGTNSYFETNENDEWTFTRPTA